MVPLSITKTSVFLVKIPISFASFITKVTHRSCSPIYSDGAEEDILNSMIKSEELAGSNCKTKCPIFMHNRTIFANHHKETGLLSVAAKSQNRPNDKSYQETNEETSNEIMAL